MSVNSRYFRGTTTRPNVKRLFLSLPDPLPESLERIAWRLPGADPAHGEATVAAELPGADEIWLALPAGRVLLSDIKLSKRALRQLHGALGNVLEDRLMLDPANAHVALGKPQADDVHPVAVVEIAWLERLLELCRRHGIEPAGAIPETLLWRGEDIAGQWSARWNGHDGFVRGGPCAGFALDDGDADSPPLALQLALAEARRRGAVPGAIALESELSVDTAAWSRVLDCPVIPQTLQPDPHPPAINLLQGAYARRRGGWFAGIAGGADLGRDLGGYRLAAGLAAAALGVHLLGTVADWARLSWENRQLRAEMTQVFKDTFPQTQAIVDPALQMRRQLADLRRERGFLAPGDFLHALNATAGQVGGVAGLNYTDGRLTLVQPAATDLDGLSAMLASQGYQLAAAGGEDGERQVVIERSQP